MYFQYNGYLIHLVRRANARRLSMTAHKGKDSLTLTLPPWLSAWTPGIRRTCPGKTIRASGRE